MHDDLTMLFGKHRNKLFKDVPDEYLILLYKTKGWQFEELKEHIEARFDKWKLRGKEQVEKEEKKRILSPIVPPVAPKCTKRAFITKEEARREMRRIQERIKGRYKTPQRSYECPDCGYWHLTSRPDRRFK